MKKALIGLLGAAIACVSAPAVAYPYYNFHIQYLYLDDSGAVVGSFTVYCNGFEVTEGVVWTANYRVTYGSCNAP